MNIYAFGKKKQVETIEPQVKIYCNVAYCFKDDAKIKGAKWDADMKKWYFIYNFEDFKDNKKLHTFIYPPFKIVKIGDIKATEENILLASKSRSHNYGMKNPEFI